MEFRVRRCGPGDELALSLVAQGTILETYAGFAEGTDLYEYVTTELSVDTFRTLLTSDRVRVWCVETEIGKCIVGYALVISAMEGEAFAISELQRLYVFSRFHRIGVGRMLMETALQDAYASKTQRMILRVYAQNASAIAFYERHGFRLQGEEQFRAGDSDYQVLVMERGFS